MRRARSSGLKGPRGPVLRLESMSIGTTSGCRGCGVARTGAGAVVEAGLVPTVLKKLSLGAGALVVLAGAGAGLVLETVLWYELRSSSI